mmetsp:Transcript_18927/g.30099  ORF Transcript_18927/g.30099 Transcript_18927/m.30099 type:complete len:210 (-) Transcript_18927:1084-1713(-)
MFEFIALCFSVKARIEFLSEMFGVSTLSSSRIFVSGDVSCLCSHSSIAALSYVWPSLVMTGSLRTSCVRGHRNSLGNVRVLAYKPSIAFLSFCEELPNIFSIFNRSFNVHFAIALGFPSYTSTFSRSSFTFDRKSCKSCACFNMCKWICVRVVPSSVFAFFSFWVLPISSVLTRCLVTDCIEPFPSSHPKISPSIFSLLLPLLLLLFAS